MTQIRLSIGTAY